jgi:hypothetical protein
MPAFYMRILERESSSKKIFIRVASLSRCILGIGMDNNLDLQLRLQESSTMEKDYRSTGGMSEDTREWISALNTSILTTRTNMLRDRSPELASIMQTPEFTSLLFAAQYLGDSLGLSKEEATERIIDTFRKLDSIWGDIVIKRGIQAMID